MALDDLAEGHYLDAELLADPVSHADEEESAELGRILYKASFAEMEEHYVNYDTVQWILISLLLILVYGVGFLMLLYVPIRRYVVRQDIRTRKLYVTSSAIVYKVTRPIFLPCFGVSKREKHLLLHLVTDVSIEQGCLQSRYGLMSVKVEGFQAQNRLPPSDDFRVQGMSNPRLFKQVVLMAVSNIRKGEKDDSTSAQGSEESQVFDTPAPVARRNGWPNSQTWPWRQSLNPWQMSYSPLPSQPQERGMQDGAVLRRLEGIEASMKVLGLCTTETGSPCRSPSAPPRKRLLHKQSAN